MPNQGNRRTDVKKPETQETLSVKHGSGYEVDADKVGLIGDASNRPYQIFIGALLEYIPGRTRLEALL